MTTDVTKVLGQSAPNATTEADLYTAPGSTATTISSIVVCNRGATTLTFRISISVGGGATAAKDYIYYDVLLAVGDTFIVTCGLTISATDKVRVYASTANASFSMYGIERS